MNKTKAVCFFFLVVIFCLFLSQAQAGYYRYTDDEGNVVFTDDLSKIPEASRSRMKSYKSIQSKNVEKDEVDKTFLGPFPKNEDGNGYDFNARKKQLEDEHDWLMEIRRQLNIEKDLINTPEKQERYNKKVRRLNEQIDAYKLKIQEHNDRLMR